MEYRCDRSLRNGLKGAYTVVYGYGTFYKVNGVNMSMMGEFARWTQ